MIRFRPTQIADLGWSTFTLGVTKSHLCKSLPLSRLQAIRFNTPHANARAIANLEFVTWKNVLFRLACKITIPVLALKREQEQMLVSQLGRSQSDQARSPQLAGLQLPFHRGCG